MKGAAFHSNKLQIPFKGGKSFKGKQDTWQHFHD